MRILMMVSNDVVHDPRVVKEARALRAAGHEMSFVGWDRQGNGPAFREWDGFPIHLVRTRGFVRLFWTDLFRNPLWWRLAYRIARRIPFEAVHCHDLDTLPIGTRLRRRTGRPLVYDCHEVFGYVIDQDVPAFVVDYAFRMERRLASQVDRIIAVNEYVKRYIDGVSGQDSVVVRNCHELITPDYRAPPGPPFTIIYLGTLHPSRFIVEAIEVIGEIPGARLIVGGSKKLTPVVKALCGRNPNTPFVGIVPHDRVLPMTIDSHAVLAMSDPALRITHVGLMNKMFEAMVAGRPSIVTERTPMAEIVAREACGLPVPYTKGGLRDAVERLRDDPALAERLGRSGLGAAKREYNWHMEQKRLVALYEGLRGS